MNTQVRSVFRGKVVNKAHTINTGVDEFPRYVVEYLIDNYCAEETFHQDMEKVVRRLEDAFVHGAEAQLLPAYILDAITLTQVQTVEEVLRHALLVA